MARVSSINPHTLQELKAEIEAVVEDVTGDKSRNTVDKFVAPLQGVQVAEICHVGYVLT